MRRKIKEIEERKTAEGLELKRQIEKLEQQHEALTPLRSFFVRVSLSLSFSFAY